MVVKIIEKQCAHAQDEERRAAFKIGVSYAHRGMFSAFAGAGGCQIGPENRNGARKGSVVAEKTENYHVCEQQGRGEPRSKSPILICAAGCFRLLRVFKGIESVRNHEMGLEGGQWLLRKLRIKVATAWSRSLSL